MPDIFNTPPELWCGEWYCEVWSPEGWRLFSAATKEEVEGKAREYIADRRRYIRINPDSNSEPLYVRDKS